MSLESNKAIARRFVEEVQSQHNLDLSDEFLDRDLIDHSGFSDNSLNGV